MPSAGFYSIHTNKLSFRRDGRWYADEEPILHQRLARLFSRHLRRKPCGGYEIWIDERYHADIEVEDTPYVVIGAEFDENGEVRIELNDGTTEMLRPGGLQVGSGDVLYYCGVKDGRERARFLRSAYYQLAPHIEETAPGQFQLRCGKSTHPIAKC